MPDTMKFSYPAFVYKTNLQFFIIFLFSQLVFCYIIVYYFSIKILDLYYIKKVVNIGKFVITS